MTDPTTPPAGYAAELARLVRALATARDGEARDALAPGASPDELHLFAEELADKRREKLAGQLSFVAGAFDDFDRLLTAYTAARPLAAFATTTSDGDRFLEWLGRTHPLTAEQRDYVACQRARHAVEDEARRNRPGHVRFQELRSAAGRLAGELGTNPGLRVHLNPIHAWSRFRTPALLGEGGGPPADVVFYAVGNEVGTAVLAPAGRALVRRLARTPPRTVGGWLAGRGRPGRAKFLAACRDLAGVGLVAFS